MTTLTMQGKIEPWSLHKPSVRADRSNSTASSPQSIRSDQLEISLGLYDAEEQEREQFHTRYLSSEEDLSSEEADMAESLLDFEDDVEVFEFEEAKIMPITIASKPVSRPCSVPLSRPKAGQLAQLVCIVPAGRATVIDVPPTPRKNRFSAPARPMTRFSSSSSRRSARLSLSSEEEPRRRTIHSPDFSHLASDSSEDWPRSSMSSTRRRPVPNRDSSKRHSMLIDSPPRVLSTIPSTPNTPYTSNSSSNNSFLNSDPFQEDRPSSASPTINRSSSSAHKRLRSISKSLVLAKIAISKKIDPKEREPHTPVTPQQNTYHPTNPSALPNNKHRLVPRDAKEDRSTSLTADLVDFLERAPAPTPERQAAHPSTRPKLVARGAAERSSPFEYYLDNDASSEGSLDDDLLLDIKPRNLRRRKSLVGLR